VATRPKLACGRQSSGTGPGSRAINPITQPGGRSPASVEVLSTPDSGLIEPVKQMMLASQFSARAAFKGAAVRVDGPDGGGTSGPPPPEKRSRELGGDGPAAKSAQAARTARSRYSRSLSISELTHPTDGERALRALLVRGHRPASARGGRNSAARADLGNGPLHCTQKASSPAAWDLAPVVSPTGGFRPRLSRRGPPKPARRRPDARRPTGRFPGSWTSSPRLVSHPPIFAFRRSCKRCGSTGRFWWKRRSMPTGRVEPGVGEDLSRVQNHVFRTRKAARVVPRLGLFPGHAVRARRCRPSSGRRSTFVNY